MMLFYPRRWLRQLKPTFFTLICIGALILLRNLAYDNSVYQSISLHQKMEYQIFSSFYQKDESIKRVFRKKVAHLNELGLSNVDDNESVQDDIKCRHPKLDLSNDANKAAFYDVGSIQCFGRELFAFENGVLRFNRTSLRGDVIKKCSYQAVERIDDNYATYTTPLTRNSSPFDMVLQHDFIRVQCYFEIEEHTDYQRNLLSVNSQHGKHLLSIPEEKIEKISLKNRIQHENSKNIIFQPPKVSGTHKTRKKMVQHSTPYSFTMPLIPKESSLESNLKPESNQKMVKNRTILLSPEKDEKYIKEIRNINLSTSSDKNSFNILQNQLQESGEKERILQQLKSYNHSKKISKEFNHSLSYISNPLSVEKHQNFNQKLNNITKELVTDSNSDPKIINQSIKIPQPPLLVESHPNLRKDRRNSANNILKSQETSAKNKSGTKIQVNKGQTHMLHALFSTNITDQHKRQQLNSSYIGQHKNTSHIGQWPNTLYFSQQSNNTYIRQNLNTSHTGQRPNTSHIIQRSSGTHRGQPPNSLQKSKNIYIGQQSKSLNSNKKIKHMYINQQPNNLHKGQWPKSLHKGQQPNNSHFQRMNKSKQVKKILKKKEIIHLSLKLSKQKNLQNKFIKSNNGHQLSDRNHLKNKGQKEIYKLVGKGNSKFNHVFPALGNISSKRTNSQKNKTKQIVFRELNDWELNIKQGHYYPAKKKRVHSSRGGRLDSVYSKATSMQKSQQLGMNQKKNVSLWQNRVLKPIRKYFKKLPTHLAQLPELKERKNIISVNKTLKSSLNISGTNLFPSKNSVVPQLVLEPKLIPSLNQPISDTAGQDKTSSYNRIKTSIRKSKTKPSHLNTISDSQENQVQPIPLTAQANQTFDIFAIKPKSAEVKKTITTNDSASYDSSKEMYINLPPEDYGINEELPDVEQFFVQVYPKPDVFQRISEVPPFVRINVIPLNILIYGLDSLSHLSFQRKLPQTYKYLKNSLDAIIMNGYNIVGDATTAAIIPLLTGKTETELPEVRKNQLASGFVDDYPLIWNKYRSKGYATLFAEDSPSLAVFNLRFNGFYTAPTDHYMRPFWQAVSESVLHERSLKFCLGSKPKHQFTLDYVKEFFQKYNNVSKFAFAFHGELSHNDNNPVQYLDKDFVHFLQKMQQNNFLNNTLLIVMSDHGARYSNVRNTVQGKLEERLPFMSFVFPPWFHKKYPYFVNNLKNNRENLVTPFDVHETLLDLLDMSRMYEPVDYSTRGISLLQSVPLNRTCRSAGIAMHWCSCLTRFDVNPSTPLVQISLHKILSYIRTLLLPVKHLCAELSLKKIMYAYLVTPNEKVLKFTNSKDADNRVANFSHQMLLETVHYQLTFETYPNGGLYEASVQVDIRKESFQVFPEISRLNKYGEQPSCIKETFPDLRKYCYCKIR